MIGAGTGVRVFAHAGPCDMRKQMNGLSAMVREKLGRDPQSGDLFVFRNRRSDMLKILFFDQGGYCLLAKRLDHGTFRLALSAATRGEAVEISHRELASLLKTATLVQNVPRAA